jgi:hypothetical protein
MLVLDLKSIQSKLNAHKLAFIHTLVRGPLFADRRSRFGLVSAVARWIGESISGDWDKDRDNAFSTSAISPHSRVSPTIVKENLRLCLNITAELVDRLQKVGDRLERGKQEEPKPGNGPHSDPAAREEDYRRCIDVVSELLPKLLGAYADLVNPYKLSDGLGSLYSLVDGSLSMYDDSVDVSAPITPLSINTSMSTAVGGQAIWSAGMSSMSVQPQMKGSPPTSRTMASLYAPQSVELAELGSTIIALLHLLPSAVLRPIFARKTDEMDLMEQSVITTLFVVLQSLMRGDAFPSTWVAANFLVSRMSVKALRAVSHVLKAEIKYDAGEDDGTTAALKRVSYGSALPTSSGGVQVSYSGKRWQSLWADFFGILLQLLNSRWLSIESFSPQRARAAHRLLADVRGDAGELLRSMWESLTQLEKQGKGVQLAFIPNLVGPFLELTMSPHPRLREAAVELLFRYHLFEPLIIPSCD